MRTLKLICVISFFSVLGLDLITFIIYGAGKGFGDIIFRYNTDRFEQGLVFDNYFWDTWRLLCQLAVIISFITGSIWLVNKIMKGNTTGAAPQHPKRDYTSQHEITISTRLKLTLVISAISWVAIILMAGFLSKLTDELFVWALWSFVFVASVMTASISAAILLVRRAERRYQAHRSPTTANV